MNRIIWIIILAWSVTGNDVMADEPEFTASAPGTVKIGQQFQYTIQGNNQANISLPEAPQFDLRGGPFSSFSSSTQWINGKMTATTTASYTYIFTANQVGEFTIPPATIRVKRDEFKTNEVTITVVEDEQAMQQQPGSTGQGQSQSRPASGQNQSGENPKVFLKVIPSKQSVYLGEQLVSELKIYTRVNTRPAANMKDIPYEGFYKHRLEPDQSASRERINGVEHISQVLQRHVIIPQKSGKMVIGPFESEWTIPQRVQRRRPGSVFDDFFDDPFNDPFFDSYKDVPVTLATDPVTINVKPLPAGAPDGFTGGVGDFSVDAALSENRIGVNDALNLVVTIRGTGNISLLGEPEVSFPPDHDVYETVKKVDVNTSGNRISGTARFEYPIVARHAGTYRIAPVTFSWFDPAKESYRTVTTEEFTFTVEKGEGTSGTGTVVIPGRGGENVADLGSDILDITRQKPAFTPIGRSVVGQPIYWIAYLVIFLIFIAVALLLQNYFRRKADVQLTRNRKASKMARNRLKAADRARKNNEIETFFEETEKAVWGYLSDKLGIEFSDLSRDRVSEILGSRGVAEDISGDLFRIIDDCEFSRYAPSAEKRHPDELYDDAVQLIKNLEQNIRK